MLRNTGGGILENVSDRLGPGLPAGHGSRGAAIGDFDNDGDLDLLVNNNGAEPQFLRNDGGNANHWLEILLIGTKSNRDGVGARVKVTAGIWSCTTSERAERATNRPRTRACILDWARRPGWTRWKLYGRAEW